MTSRQYIINLRDARFPEPDEDRAEFRRNLKDFVALRNDKDFPHLTPVYNAVGNLLAYGKSQPLDIADWVRACRRLTYLVPNDDSGVHYFHSQFA